MAAKQNNSTPYDTEETLRATADKLRELLDSVELHGSGEHGSTIADVARISVALTSTCAELRQHSKARSREIAGYPLDQIMAYLRTLPEATKADLAKELSGADREEPLL